jgi:transposase
VVGLYVTPPAHAIVLCVDEKSQIEALDRSQPLLPMRPGQIAKRTHDYTRHGTTSPFAALDIATGKLIGKCYPRHRASEFRKFLDEIEGNVPADLDVHLIMDNYATHKTQILRDWLAKRPRWHVHFTPTSASLVNQVERFFALLTQRQIKRVFTAVSARFNKPSPILSNKIMQIQSPSVGQNPPTISLLPSNASASEIYLNQLLVQDTRPDVENIDWQTSAAVLDAQGWAVIPALIGATECAAIARL